MSYAPSTDFIALLRQTANGVRSARMPGLDFAVEALFRASVINLYIGSTAPVTNQASTVWLKPASPTWNSEGTVYLWNAATGVYVAATPALWAALFVGAGAAQNFQALKVDGAVSSTTAILAIEKVAPTTTTLSLPAVATRANRLPLQIVDWSTSITNHAIKLVPNGSETIMQQNLWSLLSTPNQLAGLTLTPVIMIVGVRLVTSVP